MAKAPISMPSITRCGLPSRSERSMYAPGPPSSALQTTYFGSPSDFLTRSHYHPAAKTHTLGAALFLSVLEREVFQDLAGKRGLHDGLRVLGLHMHVKRLVRENLDVRLDLAEAMAAGGSKCQALFRVQTRNRLRERRAGLGRTGRATAGAVPQNQGGAVRGPAGRDLAAPFPQVVEGCQSAHFLPPLFTSFPTS